MRQYLYSLYNDLCIAIKELPRELNWLTIKYQYYLRIAILFGIFIFLMTAKPKKPIDLSLLLLAIVICLSYCYLDNKQFVDKCKTTFNNKPLVFIISTPYLIYINCVVSEEVCVRTGFTISFFHTSTQVLFILISGIILFLFIVSALMGILAVYYQISLSRNLIWLDKSAQKKQKLCYQLLMSLIAIKFIFAVSCNYKPIIGQFYYLTFEKALVKTSFNAILNKHCLNNVDLYHKYGNNIRFAIIDSHIISVAIPNNNGRYEFKTDFCERVKSYN
ncbi:hypothetical protein [Avibacterium sp. 21-599]|uniref:hypothetical protein n=1 Tax=Avibacterium sp. 21-599 TaxID=2911528 RepID=UPI0022471CB4|nr:hypothetical protein [Avibacterium sp. 21-599]MCW9717717.1 hypothetical protein [Avibacterium sp. 21-599]